MKMKSYIAAAGLALMPILSQAGVVYEWEATNNDAPRGISLRMEFDEATVQSGRFEFEYSGQGDRSAWLPQGLGLISLSFGLPVATGVIFTQDTGSGNVGTYYQFLSMYVSFGDYMTGGISAANFETGFSMSSIGNGPNFEITSLVSDAPVDAVGCVSPQVGPCAGATGVIRRANEVPEPGSLALIGAGLLAASRVRRKAIA